MVRFTCISISSPIGRRVCSILVVQLYNCTYSRLPEDELSGSKYVEDTKKLQKN